MGSLTDMQRSVIVGSLLGDGTMRCKANALLEVNHLLELTPLSMATWLMDDGSKSRNAVYLNTQQFVVMTL